jgi:hypothetical protein
MIKMINKIEKERIAFSIDKDFKEDIVKYCKSVGASLSSYIKNLIGDDLIEKGYRKGGAQE